ncbi:MAG: O-antigen ligase family protein [Candidatus Omnitrophica bacterium]|jgi:O-antigen ligase|nr:O-antigen ligase family protein [Candidatus Omnitrophota bacterium]
MKKAIEFIGALNYWSVIILPFAMLISTGLMNTFIVLVIVSFLLSKILKKEPPAAGGAILLFLLFIIAALASFHNSVDYRASIKGIEKLLKYGFLLWACSGSIRDEKHLKRVAVSIAFSVCLVGLDGFWQLVSGSDFIRGNALRSCSIHLLRATASFSSPNSMGIYLAVLTPFLCGLGFFFLKGWKKLFMIIAAACGAAGILMTFSGGAAIGFFTAVLFLALVRRHKVILICILAILLATPFIIPRNLKDWARQVNYNPVVFVCSPQRITLYATAWNMIRHHPVTGVGINTFSKNYSNYKLAEMEKYAATPDGMYGHNNFLHLTAETGFLGLGIFLGFLFMLFRGAWRRYLALEDDFLKISALSLIACVIAFLVNGLTETSLFNQIGASFWFVAGLLLSLNNFSVKKEIAER